MCAFGDFGADIRKTENLAAGVKILQQNCLSECEFSAVNSALSLSSGFLVFLYLRNGNKSTHPSFPDPIIQSPGIQVFSDTSSLTVPRQIRIVNYYENVKKVLIFYRIFIIIYYVLTEDNLHCLTVVCFCEIMLKNKT